MVYFKAFPPKNTTPAIIDTIVQRFSNTATLAASILESV